MSEITWGYETNGTRVIEEIKQASYHATTWEDEDGAYHDDGWNQSWPDGWKNSHG